MSKGDDVYFGTRTFEHKRRECTAGGANLFHTTGQSKRENKKRITVKFNWHPEPPTYQPYHYRHLSRCGPWRGYSLPKFKFNSEKSFHKLVNLYFLRLGQDTFEHLLVNNWLIARIVPNTVTSLTNPSRRPFCNWINTVLRVRSYLDSIFICLLCTLYGAFDRMRLGKIVRLALGQMLNHLVRIGVES